MNAILKSLRVKDSLDTPAEGDSDEIGQRNSMQSALTPANQAAKLMLLSLLARYELGSENDS